MDAKELQQDIYNDYIIDRDRRNETHVKKSFWASDCLKPLNELFWAWTNVPKTNLVSPEKMAMFDIGKLCELHIIRRLQKIGFAADLESDEDIATVEKALKKALFFAKEKDEFGCRQIRMEMEREYVPVTGYLDGISLRGEPIEVKSTRSTKYIKDVATGKPPQVEHLYQLCCYMDFTGSDVGWLIVTSRPDGAIMIVKVEKIGSQVYSTTSHSLGMPEESEPIDFDPNDENAEVIENVIVDLGEEFRRWRRLYEDHIHTNKEPELEFEYRPDVTKALLDSYVMNNGNTMKIKKAIKGDRILQAHGWKPLYCDWRDLWIEKEAAQKGVKPAELLRYNDSEIEFMLQYLDSELIDGAVRKITDTRRKQLAQIELDKWRKRNFTTIGTLRRKAGVADGTSMADLVSKKLCDVLWANFGGGNAERFDSVTDTELLAIEGIGAGAVKKIREATKTFDPNPVKG